MPTSIEWTEETWNPVTGCSKVSAGCDNCYAERITNRFGGKGAFDTIVLHPERLEKPLHWRKPRTAFVNSMSDLFHADVPGEFIVRCFAVMARTPQHTYQILTKRPGRMRSLLTRDDNGFYRAVERVVDAAGGEVPDYYMTQGHLPNVWLGVSVEDQDSADKRIPVLLDTPAAVRFLSCEPLLRPVDLASKWLAPDAIVCGRGATRSDEADRALLGVLKAAGRTIGWTGIDWVIVGGESGPGARPMDVKWARALIDQCRRTGVACFVKQLGSKPTGLLLQSSKGGEPSEWPEDLRVREMPERLT